MLNNEQIANLKPGDNLLLEAFFVEKDGDNIKFTLTPPYVPSPEVFSASPYSLRFLCGADRTFCHTVDNMVKPKHEPSRLFKKGDKVRVVKCKGRDFNSWARIVKDQLLVVDIDEKLDCNISVIAENGEENSIDPAYLELVTPVEELEPYIIRECADFYAVEKDGAQYSIFFKGSYHANAKAAAETERDRLNEEWRKEQK